MCEGRAVVVVRGVEHLADGLGAERLAELEVGADDSVQQLGDTAADEGGRGRRAWWSATVSEGQRGSEKGRWGEVGRCKEICGEMWGYVGIYGEMWGDVGRCGEMWGDVGRDGGSPS